MIYNLQTVVADRSVNTPRQEPGYDVGTLETKPLSSGPKSRIECRCRVRPLFPAPEDCKITRSAISVNVLYDSDRVPRKKSDASHALATYNGRGDVA